MTLFDKDSVSNLVAQTKTNVHRPALKDSENRPTVIYPANADLYHWIQSRANKDAVFNRVYELYDTAHPEIGTILSPQMTNKIFDCKGPEAEVLSSMMVSVTRPRLMKSPEMREKARLAKSVCKVGMRSVYVLGENGYYNSPSNFIPFLRHSSYEKSDYEKMAGYGKDFSGFGLAELNGLVNRIISHMKNLDESDNWLGFHRVKPELAASTLARFHSLEWSDIFNLSCSLGRVPDFLVKSEVIDQLNIAAENEAMASAVFLKSTAIRDKAKRDFRFVSLSYKPRMYPLHDFPCLPETASKIVSMVEKMPELGGRPAFDYLWIIVPGFSMNHPAIYHQDGFFRVMIDGKLFETKSEDEVSFKIDKQLVQDGVLMPCILGERDGKCYFLTPWI